MKDYLWNSGRGVYDGPAYTARPAPFRGDSQAGFDAAICISHSERYLCMPSYMIQLSYAPTTIAGFVKSPTDRTEVIKKIAKKVGGKLAGAWLCFGEYDAVIIIDGSDNVSAVACAMAVTASGAFTKFKTTPLLTASEGLAAMKKAASLEYTPPPGA